MKSWRNVVKEAEWMHVHKDAYAYFYGAKGQVLTDAVMESLWNAEPDYFKRYTAAQKKKIFNYSRGKVGFDCSGFIAKITGCNAYSGAIWEKCREKTTPALGPAGSILWKPGHVALDVGLGFGIEMGAELFSVEMFRISEHVPKFEASGKLKTFIDYEGATNL